MFDGQEYKEDIAAVRIADADNLGSGCSSPLENWISIKTRWCPAQLLLDRLA
jgi:hypothetical protein